MVTEMDEKLSKKQELIKEAYRFGYFVGYKGHTEWVSWIAKKKREIYENASLLGIIDEVKAAYEKGLKDGKERKHREIELGLSKLESELELKETEKVDIGEEEKIDQEYKSFSKTPKIVEPPEIIRLIKYIEAPKMLAPPKILNKED